MAQAISPTRTDSLSASSATGSSAASILMTAMSVLSSTPTSRAVN